MRLIDAEKLEKYKADCCVSLTEWQEGWNDAIDTIMGETPTVDAEPMRHGHWKVLNILDYAQRPTGRKVGQCPFCGYLTGEFRQVFESHHELTNYCPNCGAKMEVDDG